MRKSILLFFLLSRLFAASYAQLIPWKAERPLTWDDFKASKKRPGKGHNVLAYVNSRLRYDLSVGENDSIYVKVYAIFNTQNSWKKTKRLKPYVLKHEQTHFDITELYARKLRRSLAAYTSTHTYNYNAPFSVRVLYEKYRTKWRHCERKYDRKTRHGRRKAAQEAWNRKIAVELDELSPYEVK